MRFTQTNNNLAIYETNYQGSCNAFVQFSDTKIQ